MILLRAGTHMAAYERALELAGVPAVATQGRGWWSRREVQDLINHLRVVVNPLDEPALLGALAAPFAGLGTDDLARLALTRRGRAGASALGRRRRPPPGATRTAISRVWTPLRGRPLASYVALVERERRTGAAGGPAELLGRAVAETGYDVHALQGPGGLRRMANVRKLIALADAYTARSGPDLRGFADHATAELDAGAPTPDAPLEVGADQAVRLMTIHGAKGLEFPVVIVADLGRQGGGGIPAVLVDDDHVGLRLPPLHDDPAEAAFDYDLLDEARVAAEIEEERRVLHVAVTRAEELLILSGTFNADKGWGDPGYKRPALSWMGPGLFAAGAFPPAGGALRIGDDDGARHRQRARGRARAPAGAGGRAGRRRPRCSRAPATSSCRHRPTPSPASPRRSATRRWPHTPAAGTPGTCGASWACPSARRARWRTRPSVTRRGAAARSPTPCSSGRTCAPVRPAPDDDAIRAAAAAIGEPLADEELPDQLRLAATFLDGPWRQRVGLATDVRREVGFALPLDADADDAPMLNGVIDLMAAEPGGRVLIVDHKTDRVAQDADLEALVARDYAIQRAIYALAALRAGAPAVEVVHLYLEFGAAATASFTAADAPALEELVRAAAAPVLAGEHPVSCRAAHRALPHVSRAARPVLAPAGAHGPAAAGAGGGLTSASLRRRSSASSSAPKRKPIETR